MSTMVNGVTNSALASAQCAARGTSAAGEETRRPKERPDPPDAVELSPVAKAHLRPPESAPIRTELVEQVRAQIAAGVYLTDDKLHAAIDRLHDELLVVE